MKFTINAETRSVQGSGASRRLRRAGKVPAIVYGGDSAPLMVEIDHNEIYLALRKEAFHSAIISLNVGGKAEQVLLRDFQVHAYKPRVHHVDFQRIDAAHELHIKVPLHFINAELCPGVKNKGGLFNQLITEIDVKCLAKDLPEYITVDLVKLDIGESLHLSQLQLPDGVKAVLHQDEDPAIANIVAPAGASADDEAAPAPAAEAAAQAGAK